jgi:hypothetical protein
MLSLVASVALAGAACAQTPPKPTSPGEMAEIARMKAEKHEACRQKAKEQKLSLIQRRQFVKSCDAS